MTEFIKGNKYKTAEGKEGLCVKIISEEDIEGQVNGKDYIGYVILDFGGNEKWLYKPDGECFNPKQPSVDLENSKSDPIEKTSNEAEKLGNALLGLLQNGNSGGGISKDEIKAMIKEEAKDFKHTISIVYDKKEEPKDLPDAVHKQFPDLVKALSSGVHVMLVGPAGSGKTHAAAQAADVLKRKYYSEGSVLDPFTLTGYRDAGGNYQTTAFRQAFEHGGVMLFDEFDAYDPNASLVVNQALANGHMNFPDMAVGRNDDFIAIAACNTFGRGADRQYVGRNQLDAASLDRFIVMEWDYDESIEKSLTDNTDWCDTVHKIREATIKEKERLIVSTRAIINGSKLLAQGFKREDVLNSVIFKGIPNDTVSKIRKRAGV